MSREDAVAYRGSLEIERHYADNSTVAVLWDRGLLELKRLKNTLDLTRFVSMR